MIKTYQQLIWQPWQMKALKNSLISQQSLVALICVNQSSIFSELLGDANRHQQAQRKSIELRRLPLERLSINEELAR